MLKIKSNIDYVRLIKLIINDLYCATGFITGVGLFNYELKYFKIVLT